MVKAYTSTTPRLGMVPPPPMLYNALGHTHRVVHGSSTNQSLLLVDSRTNDRLGAKGFSRQTFIRKVPVPSMVVAAETSSSEDEDSISDASSCRDFDSTERNSKSLAPVVVTRPTNSFVSNWKLALPKGKPLRAKPSLIKFKLGSIYSRTTTQADDAPIKKVIAPKTSPRTNLPRSSCLTPEEKLFVEAATTLAQVSRREAAKLD